MKKAVILLGAGVPMYGNWCFNLAVSIHAQTPDMPIIIVTDSKSEGIREITPDKMGEFYAGVSLYEEDCKNDSGIDDFLRGKNLLYKVSKSFEGVFDEFLFLDADVIILPGKSVESLFSGKDFNISCRGSGKLPKYDTYWLKGSDVTEMYPQFVDKTMYNVSSETISWKHTKEMDAYWESVEKYYDQPKTKFTKFGFGTPDEIAHSLAMMEHGIELDNDSWMPHFWERHDKKTPNITIMGDYIGFSIGGNTIRTESARFYNNTVQNYMQARRIRNWWPARSKREFLPDRSNI